MLTRIAIAIDDLYGLRGKQPWHIRELNEMVLQRKAAAFNAALQRIEEVKKEFITFPAHASARAPQLTPSTPDGDSTASNQVRGH